MGAPIITSVFCLVFAILLLFTALIGIRKKAFTEGYAVVWLLTSLSLVIVGIFADDLFKLSEQLGFQNLSSFLFFVGILFCLFMLMLITIHVSQLRKQQRKIVQFLALHDLRLEELNSAKK